MFSVNLKWLFAVELIDTSDKNDVEDSSFNKCGLGGIGYWLLLLDTELRLDGTLRNFDSGGGGGRFTGGGCTVIIIFAGETEFAGGTEFRFNDEEEGFLCWVGSAGFDKGDDILTWYLCL